MIEIPQDIPLKGLFSSVGVIVTSYDGRGVKLVDSESVEQLHDTIYAAYEAGQEIYLQKREVTHD